MSNYNLERIKKNPLTKLPNIFSLATLEMSGIFGGEGVIVMADYKAFEKINRILGREKGDLCLETIGEVLIRELKAYTGAQVLFSSKDEFTLVFKAYTFQETEEAFEAISDKIIEALTLIDIPEPAFHRNYIEYHEPIDSIEAYYRFLYNNRVAEGRFNTEYVFLETITENFRHIREALERLDDVNKLALTDDISGLENNRAATRYLDGLQMNRASDRKTSILFIDGDNLKRYNNVSYQAGNEMIRDLANILMASVREEDKVYRWLSGDEFVVVLRHVVKDEACMLAERVRQKVEITAEDWLYPVTVSIGVAHFNEDMKSWQSVVDCAEKANAYAKKHGKNRVILWEDIV